MAGSSSDLCLKWNVGLELLSGALSYGQSEATSRCCRPLPMYYKCLQVVRRRAVSLQSRTDFCSCG